MVGNRFLLGDQISRENQVNQDFFNFFFLLPNLVCRRFFIWNQIGQQDQFFPLKARKT